MTSKLSGNEPVKGTTNETVAAEEVKKRLRRLL